MSGSLQEVRTLVERMLDLVGVTGGETELKALGAELLAKVNRRVYTGQVVINYHEGNLTVVSVRDDFRPRRVTDPDRT